MEASIKVGTLYWRDYTRDGGWPWTPDINKAARFSVESAEKIIAHWNKHHHDTKYKPDGETVLAHATSLSGVLPLNGEVVLWDDASI